MSKFRPKSSPISTWSASDFHSRPSQAGAMLRKLHLNRKHPGLRTRFLRDFYNCYAEQPSQKICRQLVKGKLPHVLLEIALEKQLYDEFFKDVDVTVYVLSVYAALCRVMEYATPPDDDWDQVLYAWEKHALKQFPRIWELLAEYSDILRYGEDPTRAAGSGLRYARAFRVFLAELMPLYLEMYERTRMQTLGILESDLGHAALMCWTGSMFDKLPASFNFILVLTSLTSTTPTWHHAQFLQESLTQGFVCPRTLISRCVEALQSNSDWLVDDQLFGMLMIIERICHDPAVSPYKQRDGAFVRAMLVAVQRQVCSGAEGWHPITLHRAFKEALSCLNEYPKSVSAASLDDKSVCIAVLALSRVLIPTFEDDDEGPTYFKEALRPMMNKCASALSARKGLAGLALAPAQCRVLVKSWYRTRDALIALPRAAYPLREAALEAWLALGEAARLDLRVENDDAVVPAAPLRVWRRACGWRECICHGAKPEHKLSACKGCFRVLYCSQRCQTRDWHEGGHKKVCYSTQRLAGTTDVRRIA